MDLELTPEEQSKYDTIYNQIISKYSKEDLQTLEEDDIAKYFLKNIILKFIFTGEFPSNLNITQNQDEIDNEVHFDSKIPLQEKTDQIDKIKVVCDDEVFDLETIKKNMNQENLSFKENGDLSDESELNAYKYLMMTSWDNPKQRKEAEDAYLKKKQEIKNNRSKDEIKKEYKNILSSLKLDRNKK